MRRGVISKSEAKVRVSTVPTILRKQPLSTLNPVQKPARRGRRDGIDVYEALYAIVDEAGYHLPDHDLEGISKNIAEVDQALVSDFLNGAELSERREEERRQQQAARRENILRPYRKLIDEYVLRFDASPKRYGPSQRVAAARFIEECIVITGRLPQGVQAITLGASTSYSGGDHDFTPLRVLARDVQR
jgi:hypothetical protein